jgi:hydrogenase maturation protease
MDRILVIGYGNPARRDDGLGPATAEILERQSLTNVTVMASYQLSVEDAAAIAEHDAVVFVDAAAEGPEPFFFRRVSYIPALSFSSHSLEPSSVLALARDLFDADRAGFAMGIRGYEFDGFGEHLSTQAEANLAAAVQFLVPVLRDRSLHSVELVLQARAVEEEALHEEFDE